MRARLFTKWAMTLAAITALPVTALLAQESPRSDESFDVEPPLLVPAGEPERSADESPAAPPDAAKLTRQLAQAKESVVSAERLVKVGALAKVDGEQRVLRVIRLEAALADAQMLAAKEQVSLQKARAEAGQAGKAELDATLATLARASAAAQAAAESYRKAQLDAAALNLHRQRQLLALGAARKSDVARAEEKLATLQRDGQASP